MGQAFVRMVDEDSESGCYCTDDELRGMLETHPPPQPESTKPTAAAQSAQISQRVVQHEPRPTNHYSDAAANAESNDPWQSVVDPWATPGAKRMNEKAKIHEQKQKEQSERQWDKWAETEAKPAMDAAKLL